MDELCNVQDCLGEAKFYPVLLVASHVSDEPAEIRLAYPTCEMHAKLLKLDDILPGNGWNFLIKVAFAQNGLKSPIKALTVIQWRPWENERAKPAVQSGADPSIHRADEQDGPRDEGEDNGKSLDLWHEPEP